MRQDSGKLALPTILALGLCACSTAPDASREAERPAAAPRPAPAAPGVAHPSEALVSRGPSGPAQGVEEALKARHAELKACYEVERARNPDAVRELVMDFDLDTNGRVTRFRIGRDQLKSRAAEGCFTELVRAIPFPPPALRGTVEVRYPFRPSVGAP